MIFRERFSKEREEIRKIFQRKNVLRMDPNDPNNSKKGEGPLKQVAKKAKKMLLPKVRTNTSS